MIFGKIKEYNVVTMSKRKVIRGNFGESIKILVSEKKLQEEILKALEEGGQAYALYKDKEMQACYIVTKELINIEEYISEKGKSTDISEQKSVVNQEKQQTAYVLKYQYILSDLENVRKDFEKAVLEEVKEMTLYHDVKTIAWKDSLLVSENVRIGNLEIAGGMGMGLILGVIFGVALGNLAIGMCIGVALGFAFGTSFRTLWRKSE